ncbi:MAG: DUF2892 domain-containing protein [Myxococcota bacterium]|jgi:hypothetical protein
MPRLFVSLAVSAALLIAHPARAEGLAPPSPRLLPSAGLALALTGGSATVLGVGELEAKTTVFGLPRNVGTVDRIIRGVIAATLVSIGSYRLATNQPSPGWSVFFLSIAAIPALTAATGYCPLYQALGLDTN